MSPFAGRGGSMGSRYQYLPLHRDPLRNAMTTMYKYKRESARKRSPAHCVSGFHISLDCAQPACTASLHCRPSIYCSDSVSSVFECCRALRSLQQVTRLEEENTLSTPQTGCIGGGTTIWGAGLMTLKSLLGRATPFVSQACLHNSRRS